MNNLGAGAHRSVCADAFEFLESARAQREMWGLVVLDPPSFAPSQRAVPAALASYQRLVAAGGAVTESGGLLAAASCSSHVRMDEFLQACQEGISDCRRRATVLEIRGQPADHPSPLALPEFRYLKFVIMRLD
jgi:23S rRNA (cytosine1962-C5)-methyltransferase